MSATITRLEGILIGDLVEWGAHGKSHTGRVRRTDEQGLVVALGGEGERRGRCRLSWGAAGLRKAENSEKMTAGEARACVEEIRALHERMRELLLHLYRREGWRALGYASWRECVVAEFEQSQAQLYRQLQAGEIEELVSPNGEIGAIPEGHLRPLAALPPEQRAEAWETAQARAEETGRPVTGALVEQVVKEMQAPSYPVVEGAGRKVPIKDGGQLRKGLWVRSEQTGATYELRECSADGESWLAKVMYCGTQRGHGVGDAVSLIVRALISGFCAVPGILAAAAPERPTDTFPPAETKRGPTPQEVRLQEREAELREQYFLATEILNDEIAEALETGAATPLLELILATCVECKQDARRCPDGFATLGDGRLLCCACREKLVPAEAASDE